MTYQDLENAVRRLGSIESGYGHGGHRTNHAPADCRLCADWVLAVLAVREQANKAYGPDSVARELATTLARKEGS